MTSTERRIQTLLRRAGTARSRELVAAGITRSQLSRMVAAGQLVRAARGLYAMPGYQSGEHGALVVVAKRAPGMLFCLLTALRIHDLTTQAPFEVWIAIGNKDHPPRLDYPPLRTVRFSAAALTAGVETRRVDGAKVRVTSVAKTVADCFKFRNKIFRGNDGWRLGLVVWINHHALLAPLRIIFFRFRRTRRARAVLEFVSAIHRIYAGGHQSQRGQVELSRFS